MKIKPSTYIRNDYSELSSYCRETSEPIYITKNGEGDLVVMSIEAFEELQSKMNRFEAHNYYLEKYLEGAAYNKVHPETYSADETIAELRKRIDQKVEAGALDE